MDTTEKIDDIGKNDQYVKCFNEKEKGRIFMQHRETEHIETIQRSKMFVDRQCEISNKVQNIEKKFEDLMI